MAEAGYSGGRKRRTPLIRTVIALAILAGGGAWGWHWWQVRSLYVFENDARIAADMVAIASRVDGWVTEISVSQGDRIGSRSIIARIDDREARLKAAELEARLAELSAESETIAAEIDLVRQEITQRFEAQSHRVEASEEALSSAAQEARLRQSEFNRVKSLATRRIASSQSLEQAEVELLNARSRQRAADAQLKANRSQLMEIEAARGQIDVLTRRREQIEARKKTVLAQMEQQKLDIRDRAIASPINGVVDKIFVDQGEFVRPGQRLALIHDPAKVWVETNIRETEVRNVQVGAPVKIAIDAYPGQRFNGEVFLIGDAATNQFALLPNPNPSGNFTKITQRVPVKIRIEPVEGLPLRPGMMVEVEIVIPERN